MVGWLVEAVLCCGEKLLLGGRTVTTLGRFPGHGLLSCPWRGDLSPRCPRAVPGCAAPRLGGRNNGLTWKLFYALKNNALASEKQ